MPCFLTERLAYETSQGGNVIINRQAIRLQKDRSARTLQETQTYNVQKGEIFMTYVS